MRSWIVAAVLFGTLTAYSQKPAAPKSEAGKTATATAPAPSPAAQAPATGTVAPEELKELNDAFNMFKLDQLEEQTSQSNATNTNPVAQKAMQIWKNAVTSDPNVVKAHEQTQADMQKLKDKIAKLRTQQKLDDTWDWDFNLNKFVQTKPEPGAKAAATKPNGE